MVDHAIQLITPFGCLTSLAQSLYNHMIAMLRNHDQLLDHQLLDQTCHYLWCA